MINAAARAGGKTGQGGKTSQGGKTGQGGKARGDGSEIVRIVVRNIVPPAGGTEAALTREWTIFPVH